MVKEITQQNQTLYQCEDCGFKYKERELAEKCEKWCTEKGVCNMEITRQAIHEK